MPSNGVKWKDEWIDMVAKNHAIGKTAEKIAFIINEAFKISMSRNSVIGKINRLRGMGDPRFVKPTPEMLNGKPIQGLLDLWKEGVSSVIIGDQYNLNRTTVSKKAVEYGLKPRPQNHGAKLMAKERNKGKKVVTEAYTGMSKFINPNALSVSLLELGRGQCKFAIGNGPFYFCGLPVELGSSVPYCKDCKRIMYTPRIYPSPVRSVPCREYGKR